VPQIVCWQLAMIVAGLGLREPVAIKIVAGVTALLLLTGVSVRWGGEWLYQWIAHGIRFCLRRRSLRAATISQQDAPVVPALLAKDTWTRSVQLDPDAAGPAEATTDAVADAGGVSATLWLPAGDSGRIDALPSARDLLDVMEKQPVTMVAQTVLHTGTRPDEPARTWIAVRARRSADLAGDTDLEAVLANGLRRVVRRLDRLRIDAEPLTGQAFPDTLAALAHVSGGRDVLTESWAACRTGPVIQVTYRLAGFDQLPHAAAGLFLEHVLHRPERVATTVAVTAWRAPGAAARAGTVLRIAAVNRSALDQAAHDIARLAAEFGVRPERLDGRHRAGVLASLPLGHTTPGGSNS
jgi:type VII secretion protein EccE